MNSETLGYLSHDIKDLLTSQHPSETAELYQHAQRICTEHCGTGVILRGIVEFSNYCRNSCRYCGLRRQNRRLPRYRLSIDQILKAVNSLYRQGIGTVVLQSGEDPYLSAGWLTRLIERIKRSYDLAVTLSVGEWSFSHYKKWRSAGADRYLLKIETTDSGLYQALHPGMDFFERLRCLDALDELGYQCGSGIIIGLPGQTTESIAEDLNFLHRRDFDMLSIGPFIPHPLTPLSPYPPGSIDSTCAAIAVARCVTKNSHIPATSALAAWPPDYRYRALLAGANVIMPNFTPPATARYYDIYPHNGRTKTHQNDALASAVQQVLKANKDVAYYTRGDSLKPRRTSCNDENT
ncbi:MAG: [FeFe] hydrogenase H-cluster radical SAM maturase HydE [Spirochaetia bacterium]